MVDQVRNALACPCNNYGELHLFNARSVTLHGLSQKRREVVLFDAREAQSSRLPWESKRESEVGTAAV